MINESPGVHVWASVSLFKENGLCEALITNGIKATGQDLSELSINKLCAIFTAIIELNSSARLIAVVFFPLANIQSVGNEFLLHFYC